MLIKRLNKVLKTRKTSNQFRPSMLTCLANQNITKKGFALTTLIVFTTIGMMAIATSVYLIVDSFVLTSKASLAEEVEMLAKSGAEEAKLRLLRNPLNSSSPYSGGSVVLGADTISIQISGGQILSTAQKYGIIKQVKLTL